MKFKDARINAICCREEIIIESNTKIKMKKFFKNLFYITKIHTLRKS